MQKVDEAAENATSLESLNVVLGDVANLFLEQHQP